MNLKIVAAILAALMLCAALPAWSQGFGGMGRHFGRMGINGKKASGGGGGGGCSPTGLIFNTACNSMYLTTVIH